MYWTSSAVAACAARPSSASESDLSSPGWDHSLDPQSDSDAEVDRPLGQKPEVFGDRSYTVDSLIPMWRHLKGLSRLADEETVPRPQDPKVKEAIIAALLSGCRNGHLAVPEKGANLSEAWDRAFIAAFDAACPPGKFESWARKSHPKIAACFHVAKLETTSPKRSDAIQLSAAVILETQG